MKAFTVYTSNRAEYHVDIFTTEEVEHHSKHSSYYQATKAAEEVDCPPGGTVMICKYEILDDYGTTEEVDRTEITHRPA